MFAHCHSQSLPQICSAYVSDFSVADFTWHLLSRQLELNWAGKCCGSSIVLLDQNLLLQTGEKKQPTNCHKFVLQLDKTFNEEFSTEAVFSAKLKFSKRHYIFLTFKEKIVLKWWLLNGFSIMACINLGHCGALWDYRRYSLDNSCVHDSMSPI